MVTRHADNGSTGTNKNEKNNVLMYEPSGASLCLPYRAVPMPLMVCIVGAPDIGRGPVRASLMKGRNEAPVLPVTGVPDGVLAPLVDGEPASANAAFKRRSPRKKCWRAINQRP